MSRARVPPPRGFPPAAAKQLHLYLCVPDGESEDFEEEEDEDEEDVVAEDDDDDESGDDEASRGRFYLLSRWASPPGPPPQPRLFVPGSLRFFTLKVDPAPSLTLE